MDVPRSGHSMRRRRAGELDGRWRSVVVSVPRALLVLVAPDHGETSPPGRSSHLVPPTRLDGRWSDALAASGTRPSPHLLPSLELGW